MRGVCVRRGVRKKTGRRTREALAARSGARRRDVLSILLVSSEKVVQNTPSQLVGYADAQSRQAVPK